MHLITSLFVNATSSHRPSTAEHGTAPQRAAARGTVSQRAEQPASRAASKQSQPSTQQPSHRRTRTRFSRARPASTTAQPVPGRRQHILGGQWQSGHHQQRRHRAREQSRRHGERRAQTDQQARAPSGLAPTARLGSSQGVVWASGWFGHGKLSTFARQAVSAALLRSTCGRGGGLAHALATVRAPGCLGLATW